MVTKNLQDSSHPQWPEAAQTLMALMHAQGEVARLSEREQLFSSLLVSVNAVLWAFNWETRKVLYVSPAYERIFGRSAGLLLADYNQWRDSIYPDDLDYAERSLAEVLVKGAVEDREYRIIATDGQVRWLSDKCFINRQAEPGQPVIIVALPRTSPKRSKWKPSFNAWRPPTYSPKAATADTSSNVPIASSNRHGCKARRWHSCCWTLMTSRRSTTPTATRQATRCCNVSPRAVARHCAGVICSGESAGKSSRRYSRVARRTWPCKWPSACNGRSSG